VAPQTRGVFRGPAAYAARTPWRPYPALAAAAALLLMHFGCVWALGLALDRPCAVAISLILQVSLILGASTLFGGNPRDALALRPPAGGWRAYMAAILFTPALVGYVVFVIVLIVLRAAGHSVSLLPVYDPFFFLEGSEWALWVAVAGLLVPLREELLFRGFLLPALAQSRLGYWGAAVVVAAAWAALHGSLLALAPVLFIGLLLAWLLWRTGSLYMPILCHTAQNLLVVLAPLLGLPGVG
jgi:CAAX protease family protein